MTRTDAKRNSFHKWLIVGLIAALVTPLTFNSASAQRKKKAKRKTVKVGRDRLKRRTKRGNRKPEATPKRRRLKTYFQASETTRIYARRMNAALARTDAVRSRKLKLKAREVVIALKAGKPARRSLAQLMRSFPELQGLFAMAYQDHRIPATSKDRPRPGLERYMTFVVPTEGPGRATRKPLLEIQAKTRTRPTGYSRYALWPPRFKVKEKKIEPIIIGVLVMVD